LVTYDHGVEVWMTVVFDSYIPGSSLLHRLDPRTKLWGALLAMAWVFILPSLLWQFLFLTGIHLILLVAGIPWRTLGQLWRQMAILVVLILLLQPLLQPSGALLLAWGPVRLTVGGISEAFRLALRAVGIAFVMGTLLFTTPQPSLVRAFVRLGLPYTWGLTVSLALRFLPAIQGLYRAVRDAQASRGWVAEENLIKRIRNDIPVLVAVLIGTLRMSDQLTLALAARGLETMEARTTWHELQMTTGDWAIAVSFTTALSLFVWWRWTMP
jgi:energy-coupling factor transport system permease protein